MAWRVVDAQHAFEHAVKNGAEPYTGADKTLDVPAIKGIGGSLLYFVDRYGAKGSAYDAEFDWLGERDPKPEGVGFYYLDHLTHNVYRGNMDKWFGFYAKLFNFRQIRFFDIEGKLTGLQLARADLALRQDPHPASTSRPTTRARSRSTSRSTRARASSTSPSAPSGIYDADRRAGRQRPAVHAGPAGDLLRAELRRACTATTSRSSA